MKINYIDTLFSLSYALDCVEQELLGISSGHGKRVAYLSVHMGQALGLDEYRLTDLAACALLHDCALTEYIHEEYQGSYTDASVELHSFELHCIYGERNMDAIPSYYPAEAKNAVLYHHETANGKGAFGKKANETPLYAQLIHLANELDTHFQMNQISARELSAIDAFIQNNSDSLFDSRIVSCFQKSFQKEHFTKLQDSMIDKSLHEILPSYERELTPQQVIQFAGIFAAIIDYKSKVTRTHSMNIAKNAKKLGEYYGAGEELAAKLYLAGALHDIGKLAINLDTLEKPDKLTEQEYKHMQQHAYQTFLILRSIRGMEDVTRWASYHHEKLDGSGYPFRLTAPDLDHWSRMIACLDIYQALIEDRPYKEGMPHSKACGILHAMAEADQLDSRIVQDISQQLC